MLDKYRFTAGGSSTPKHAVRPLSSRKKKTNPTLMAKKKRSVLRAQLPDNWVELVGVEETLEQYSKEEIKRQEVINYGIKGDMILLVHRIKYLIITK